MEMPPPGWYEDPVDTGGPLRWWDGTQWTEHTAGQIPQAAIERAPGATGREYPAIERAPQDFPAAPLSAPVAPYVTPAPGAAVPPAAGPMGAVPPAASLPAVPEASSVPAVPSNSNDPSLTDWRAAYYGKNFKRLHDIKTTVDPAQVFNFAQAI